MKRIKRKSKTKPLKVIFSDKIKVIIPRQSQFKTTWLREHGCPFVSAYEVLQYCGVKRIGKKKVGVIMLWKWWKKHYPSKFRATLTIRGLELGLKDLLEDEAYVKRFSPKGVTTKRVQKYLDKGCMIIMNRRRPHGIHYYTVRSDIGEDGKRHTYILNAGKCDETTAKEQVGDKSSNAHYGGMIVITRKEKK